MVLRERVMIGSPWGSPLKAMVLKWGLSLQPHSIVCEFFHVCLTCWSPCGHMIIAVMTARMISLVSASKDVRPLGLATPGGRIYFVNFHWATRRGQSYFLPLAGNLIQFNKHVLIYWAPTVWEAVSHAESMKGSCQATETWPQAEKMHRKEGRGVMHWAAV